MGEIRVLSMTGDTVEAHPIEAVPGLLRADGTLVWVDIAECGDEAVTLLTDVLGCHPLAVRDCMQRNRVPRVRIYPHQQLLILHGPERGPSGHVHYLELDQIIGDNYVVTVHGPINPAVPAADRPLVADAVDQLNRIRGLADGEREYPQGVIEFYRARAETKMTVAAERLAVIAVVTLPITALSSIYGMNVIVNDHTHVPQLVVVLIVMAVMSALLPAWAKRRGWW